MTLKKESIGQVIISLLKLHKKNIALYQSLLNNFDDEVSIKAQSLTNMPKGSSGFNSVVENHVVKNKKLQNDTELKDLYKQIKKVNIWLDYLTDEQKFVVEQIYFEERTYSIISHRWGSRGNPIYSSGYWKTKRREAIKKISELCTICV
jgi:hypothetical protein